jgi:hypothetical protein
LDRRGGHAAGVRLGTPRDASTYALYDIRFDIFRPLTRLPEADGVIQCKTSARPARDQRETSARLALILMR